LSNFSTIGHHWDMIATGTSTTEGADKLLFKDASAGVTRMTIDSEGRVGIGTASPVDKLTVAGGGGTITSLDGFVRTRLASSNSASAGYIGTATNHSLILRTNDTDHIYVRPDGRTGIGAIPLMHLHRR
jgi:hypothetical protein